MGDLGLSTERRAYLRTYKEIFSTIVYADFHLRKFFQAAKYLPGYENTIFIVTGDHRLPEIPMSTKIDRYHVPLIIFSPMLKTSQHFLSISSYLDLAPSLLALFQSTGLEIPDEVPWVGSGLDVATAFRNIHHYPLKQTKGNLHDYISGLYFLSGTQLFKIRKNMDLASIDDEIVRKRLFDRFSLYRGKNDYVIQTGNLMPPELSDRFNSR